MYTYSIDDHGLDANVNGESEVIPADTEGQLGNGELELSKGYALDLQDTPPDGEGDSKYTSDTGVERKHRALMIVHANYL